MVVVAVPFPKALAVMGHKFEGVDPFGAFPGVEFGYNEAQGPAMFGGKWFTIAAVGKDDVFAEQIDQGEVGGVTAVGMYHDVLGLALDADVFDEFGDGDACPGVVELAPAGDTVEVGGEFCLG